MFLPRAGPRQTYLGTGAASTSAIIAWRPLPPERHIRVAMAGYPKDAIADGPRPPDALLGIDIPIVDDAIEVVESLPGEVVDLISGVPVAGDLVGGFLQLGNGQSRRPSASFQVRTRSSRPRTSKAAGVGLTFNVKPTGFKTGCRMTRARRQTHGRFRKTVFHAELRSMYDYSQRTPL